MCPAILYNILHPSPPTLSYETILFFPSFSGLRSYPSSFSVQRVPQKKKGEEGRLQSRFSASRRLLASCYFCIPVNRVWNPICLFATASKLPQQRQPCVVPFHPPCFSGTIAYRSIYSPVAHIYANTRTRASTHKHTHTQQVLSTQILSFRFISLPRFRTHGFCMHASYFAFR